MAVRHAMQIKPLYYKGRVIETTLTWFKWVFEWRNIKICKMLLALSTLLMVAAGTCANVGWKSFLRENPTEFHDLPLTWEMKKGVPDWLSGTYVRNGPAQVRNRTCNMDWIWRIRSSLSRMINKFPLQISFGSERRHMSSWLEGFAKLHSFKLDGPQVFTKSQRYSCPVETGVIQRQNAGLSKLCSKQGKGGASADGHLKQVWQWGGRVDLVGKAPHHLQDVPRGWDG